MGGPGIPWTSPAQPAPGVEPPLPDRSASDPSGVLARWLPVGLPGLRNKVSWEVKPLSWEEMLDSLSGAIRGLLTPCNKKETLES